MKPEQRAVILITISSIFLITGILKLLNNPLEVEQFVHFGYPPWFMYTTAVINIFAAIGLLIRQIFTICVYTLCGLLLLSIVSILIADGSTRQLVQPVVVLITLFIVIRSTSSK